MKTNKKFILPLILLAGGGLALYFIMKNKKKPDIAPAPPAPANLPPPSINIPTEKIIGAAKKVIAGFKKFKLKRNAAKAR
jgi:hypothetical protein